MATIYVRNWHTRRTVGRLVTALAKHREPPTLISVKQLGRRDGLDSRAHMSSTPVATGIVCPPCDQPVGIIENRTPTGVEFWCPGCNNRWTADEPGTKPH